jgi:hypothetical protein
MPARWRTEVAHDIDVRPLSLATMRSRELDGRAMREVPARLCAQPLGEGSVPGDVQVVGQTLGVEVERPKTSRREMLRLVQLD